MILDKLNYSITSLKGIGSYYSKILKKFDINTVGSLLEFFPRAFSDRTKIISLKDACSLNSATVKVKVVEHRMVGKKFRQFLKVLIHDGSNFGALVCFNRNFLKNSLVIGNTFFVTGKFNFNFGEIQSSNFEFE